MKALAKGLSSCVVFGRPDVDEYAALLDPINSLSKQTREYVFLKARRLVRNMLENGAVKNVDAAVYDPGDLGAGLFFKCNDAILSIETNRAVSRCIRNSAHRHGHKRAMVTMKPNQIAEIRFKKRVAVHDKEVGGTFQIRLRKFESACRSQRLCFLRIPDRDVPFAAISEMAFDAVGEISGAHHKVSNSLHLELQDEQLKERDVTQRRQRLGRFRQHGSQARARPSHKQHCR